MSEEEPWENVKYRTEGYLRNGNFFVTTVPPLNKEQRIKLVQNILDDLANRIKGLQKEFNAVAEYKSRLEDAPAEIPDSELDEFLHGEVET